MHIQSAFEDSIHRLEKVSEKRFLIDECYELLQRAESQLLSRLFLSRYKDQIDRNGRCVVRIV